MTFAFVVYMGTCTGCINIYAHNTVASVTCFTRVSATCHRLINNNNSNDDDDETAKV